MEANEPIVVYVDIPMVRFAVDPANRPANFIDSSQSYINRLTRALERQWPDAKTGVTVSVDAQATTIDIRPPETAAAVRNVVESILEQLFQQGGFWAY